MVLLAWGNPIQPNVNIPQGGVQVSRVRGSNNAVRKLTILVCDGLLVRTLLINSLGSLMGNIWHASHDARYVYM